MSSGTADLTSGSLLRALLSALHPCIRTPSLRIPLRQCLGTVSALRCLTTGRIGWRPSWWTRVRLRYMTDVVWSHVDCSYFESLTALFGNVQHIPWYSLLPITSFSLHFNAGQSSLQGLPHKIRRMDPAILWGRAIQTIRT